MWFAIGMCLLVVGFAGFKVLIIWVGLNPLRAMMWARGHASTGGVLLANALAGMGVIGGLMVLGSLAVLAWRALP